jgi:hypothetical protein
VPYLPIVDDDHATGKLRYIYKRIRKGIKAKRTPTIFQAFSPRHELLQALIPMAVQITFGGSSLGRRWEEMLSVAVSAWNHCKY